MGSNYPHFFGSDVQADRPNHCVIESCIAVPHHERAGSARAASRPGSCVQRVEEGRAPLSGNRRQSVRRGRRRRGSHHRGASRQRLAEGQPIARSPRSTPGFGGRARRKISRGDFPLLRRPVRAARRPTTVITYKRGTPRPRVSLASITHFISGIVWAIRDDRSPYILMHAKATCRRRRDSSTSGHSLCLAAGDDGFGCLGRS